MFAKSCSWPFSAVVSERLNLDAHKATDAAPICQAKICQLTLREAFDIMICELCSESPVLKSPRKTYPHSKLIGYARVSTTEQTLALQMDALKAYGVAHDDIYNDTASGGGSMLKRYGMQLLLADAREGDTVVVWKLDRLGRNTLELLQTVEGFMARGIQFVTLAESLETHTPGGKLVFRIMAALAEFERDQIKMRTRAGLEAAKRRGKRVTPEIKMTPKVIAQAKEMLIDGKSVENVSATVGVSRQSLYNKFGGSQIKTWRVRAKARAGK